jgi:hypothetical protein
MQLPVSSCQNGQIWIIQKQFLHMDTCSVADVGIFQLAYKTGTEAYKKNLSQPWQMLLRASTRC